MAGEVAREATPCKRCRAANASHRLRNDPTCEKCFIFYVRGKVGRRIGALSRLVRPPTSSPPRYLAGLSFGASSAVMTEILDSSARFQSSKHAASVAFEPCAVHVDTNLTLGPARARALLLLDKYRARFPNVSFECVHLSKVLQAGTVDWAALPAAGDPAQDPEQRLRRLFESLPSATARADVLRLLVRHLLLHLAVERSCVALLLGHSTTALASLTLAEVANGRGFSVPYQVSDGPITTSCTSSRDTPHEKLQLCYPLREVFGNEVATYLTLQPALAELVPSEETAPGGSIISHKDTSISEVVDRYFRDVEGPYASVIANVVRTAGKLDRQADNKRRCGLCGMALDEAGVQPWTGGAVEETAGYAGQLAEMCYGCKRSVHG